MKPARIWTGEGDRTLTGGRRPLHVFSGAPDYIQPLFATDKWWNEASSDCLDAPSHIASGSVRASEWDGEEHAVLFASEPRE